MKALALRAMTSYPVYRVIPDGPIRTYAQLRYHNARSSRQDVAAVVRSGRAPRHLSIGVIAAKAAFRTGQDATVDGLLADLVARFPHAAAPFELRAELNEFRGEYVDALADAERARLLEPARATAVGKAVRLTYRVHERSHADAVALAALKRSPTNQTVLWAVAKSCSTPEQAERILATWQGAVSDQAKLPRAVWQLATAAARGRLAELACQLYRDAIVALHENPGIVKAAAPRVLEGKGAWTAIEDITAILDKAGIPFFFAAGTTLGLVREGRPLALDGDIDVGVFDSDWDRDAFVELFRYDPRFVLDPNPMSAKVGLKHRGGSPIDIFRYYEEDGKAWHDGVFVRWDNSPFGIERREINGLSLPIPENADQYLTENYGDWRTPNPGYDVFTEAPNFHVHWPEYAHMHALRTAFRALRAGDRAEAVGILEAAGEGKLASRLGEPAPQVESATDSENQTTDPENQPRSTVDELLARAQTQVSEGRMDEARADLAAAIRDRRWARGALWTRLAALAEDAEDYTVIRNLWLETPESCAKNVTILRAVARAAMVAADEDTACTLLEKAIVVSARRARRPKAVARRALTRAMSWLPFVSPASRDGLAEAWPTEAVTANALVRARLLDAVVVHDKEGVRRYASELRSAGEAHWLDAV